MMDKVEVNWLERRVGGIINFRLPEDGADIPSRVFAERLAQYYRQCRSEILRNASPAQTSLL